jgi:hypothetical protein
VQSESGGSEAWSEIPHDGDILTPEELLIYLNSEMMNKDGRN